MKFYLRPFNWFNNIGYPVLKILNMKYCGLDISTEQVIYQDLVRKEINRNKIILREYYDKNDKKK